MTDYTPNYERILNGLGYIVRGSHIYGYSWTPHDTGWSYSTEEAARTALLKNRKPHLINECDDVLYAKGLNTYLNRLHDDADEWLYYVTREIGGIPVFAAYASTRELAILNVFEQFLEKEGK